MKIARRSMNNVWEFPLSRKDLALNLRLRRNALKADAAIQSYLYL